MRTGSSVAAPEPERPSPAAARVGGLRRGAGARVGAADEDGWISGCDSMGTDGESPRVGERGGVCGTRRWCRPPP